MKKAVAKCNQVDAPELELPPYRSVDRFVNTMVSFANNMESNQFEQLYKMMSIISQNKYEHRQDHHESQRYGSHYSMDNSMPWGKKDSPMMNKFKMMMAFKKMMSAMKDDDSFMSKPMMSYDNMKSNYNNKYGDMMENKMDMEKFEKMYKMVSEMKSGSNKYDFNTQAMPMARSETPNFEKMASLMSMMNFRSKRQASGDALALNDRLKEKIETVFEQQQQKIGNMTCVLKEMNCLNEDNEIDVRAMKKDAEQYNMPSAWFKNRYEEIIDVCYEGANNLPAKLDEQDIVKGDFGTVNMGKIKSFMSCCKSAKQKLCMNQDIKTKIESNFGTVDKILEG